MLSKQILQSNIDMEINFRSYLLVWMLVNNWVQVECWGKTLMNSFIFVFLFFSFFFFFFFLNSNSLVLRDCQQHLAISIQCAYTYIHWALVQHWEDEQRHFTYFFLVIAWVLWYASTCSFLAPFCVLFLSSFSFLFFFFFFFFVNNIKKLEPFECIGFLQLSKTAF